jgi:DNA invertase Pin-like site-specific DNA recombinase
MSFYNRAIIYLRCSTPKQNSYNTQLYNCTNYCNNNNFTIVDTIKETISATNLNKQPKLLNIINNNNNLNLIVYDISRLSRNVVHGNEILTKCKDNNIIIHSVNNYLNTNNIYGIRNFQRELIETQFESNLISSRVKSNIEHKKSLGYSVGRIPYGYSKNPDTQCLVPNKKEQNIINLILNLKYGSTFDNVNKLVNEINNENIKLLSESEFKIILYGNLTHKDIVKILEENNISYKNNTEWSDNIITNIINNNSTYNSYNEELSKQIIYNLYFGLDLNSINDIYYKINKNNITIPMSNLEKCELDINYINLLLNNYYLNYRIWNSTYVQEAIDSFF